MQVVAGTCPDPQRAGGPGPPVLEGLRVLDLSTLLAAPQIGAVLADLGADVVKVEPPAGDPLLGLGARRGGASLPYALVNRGKRRVVVDLADPEGQERLGSLLERVDVVVANQPPSVLERWGCTPEQLLERNARLVVATVSCYGWSGPLRGTAGNGSLAEAFAGLTNLTGQPDGPPVLPSVPLGDSLVGMAGALAVLAACWGRDAGRYRGASQGPSRAAGGRHVDVSMYEPIIALLGTTLAGWEPGTQPPRRTGSRVPGGAPRNVYRASDGRFLVLSATTDGQAARALEAMGVDDPATTALFASGAARAEHADRIDELVAAWIAGRPRDAALGAFADRKVPVAPVHDLAELLSHPQIEARSSVRPMEVVGAGGVPVPGPVAHFGGAPEVPAVAPKDPEALEDLLGSWEPAI